MHLFVCLAGFDNYYKSLVPRMGNECSNVTVGQNVPHSSRPGKLVNCRNDWFREFWSQHHKCTFDSKVPPGKVKCTGNEELTDYKQEGLVPFVGMYKLQFNLSIHIFYLSNSCKNSIFYSFFFLFQV